MWQVFFHSFFFRKWLLLKLSSPTLRFENENYLQNISTSLSIVLSFYSILSFEYKFQFFFFINFLFFLKTHFEVSFFWGTVEGKAGNGCLLTS